MLLGAHKTHPVNLTLATLYKAEFGFFGVVVKKLTKKLPLVSLYKIVHDLN